MNRLDGNTLLWPSQYESRRLAHFLILMSLLGLVVVGFGNSLGNDFVNWDDDMLVVDNPHIRTLNVQSIRAMFTPGTLVSYQPVRTLSYAIDYHFWELNPLGYHISNLFCHLCNTLLVYLVVFRLSRNILIAALTALLFAGHPVHVEAVTWISGRRDVLSLLFALLSVLFFLRLHHSGERKESSAFSPQAVVNYGCSFFFFSLGLLTKPSIVVLPLLLVLLDVCFFQNFFRCWKRWGIYLPFAGMSVAFVKVFLIVAQASGVAKTSYHGGEASATFLTMLRVFVEYIFLLLAPKDLMVAYGVEPVSSVKEPTFLISALVLLLLGIATGVAWKRARGFFFGISWFFISLIPVSNMIPISVVKAERYLYLPSIGFFMAFAWMLAAGWNSLKKIEVSRLLSYILFLGGLGLILFSYTVLTVQRNRDWRNSEALWTSTLEVRPDHPIALNNLGIIYAERGWHNEALAFFNTLLGSGIRYERIDGVLLNIGHIYTELQEFESALSFYQQALLRNPTLAEAYVGIGKVYMQIGNTEEAIRNFRLALQRRPKSLKAHVLLGDACSQMQQFSCAVDAYESVLSLAGDNQEILQKLERAKNLDAYKDFF